MRNQKPKQPSDLSQINQSKLIIRQYEFSQLEDQLKKVKYPTYAISNAESLSSKIQSFKDEKIKKILKKELNEFNSFRKIRGDGNCFFRAIAFVCLSVVSDPTLENCFPLLNQVSLTCCLSETIPNDFKKFYDDRFLHKMLKNHWDLFYTKFFRQCEKNPRKTLLKLLDEYPFLDFIIILYFRAVCLKTLSKMQSKLKQFLLGNEQKSIRKYRQQTEGVIIRVCSIAFNIKIWIYQVRAEEVKVYQYGEQDKSVKINKEVQLFFQDNHYDIIQNNQRIQQQKDSLRSTKASYYGDVSKKMTDGQCVQCYDKCLVYQQSSVCSRCFQKLQKASMKFQGGKMKRAYCDDCGRFKDTVLQDIGICRQCLTIQNQIQQKRKKRQQKQKLQIDQKNVNDEQKQKANKKKDKQREEQTKKQKEKPKTIRGKCFECKFTQDIDSETGICSYCYKNQKKALDYLQKKTKQKLSQIVKDQYAVKNNRNNQLRQQTNTSPKKRDNKYGIGQQIPKTRVSNIQRQPSGHKPPKQSSNFFPSTYQSIISICQKCQKERRLQSGTPICQKCYRENFQQTSRCKQCAFTEKVHFQTKQCKQCHYKKYKRPNKMCKMCHSIQPIKEGYCLSCIKKYYCQQCQKIKLTDNIINRKCFNCRNYRR